VRDSLDRANERAHRIFAMAALDRRCPGGSMGHIQARVSLQSGLAVCFRAGCDAGVTPNTLSIISDYKSIHFFTIECGARAPGYKDLNVYLHENESAVIGLTLIFSGNLPGFLIHICYGDSPQLSNGISTKCGQDRGNYLCYT